MILVASCACVVRCIGFCCVEFQLPRFHPIDALSSSGFQFYDDLTNVAPSCRQSYIVHEREAFESADPLLHPLYEP